MRAGEENEKKPTRANISDYIRICKIHWQHNVVWHLFELLSICAIIIQLKLMANSAYYARAIFKQQNIIEDDYSVPPSLIQPHQQGDIRRERRYSA